MKRRAPLGLISVFAAMAGAEPLAAQGVAADELAVPEASAGLLSNSDLASIRGAYLREQFSAARGAATPMRLSAKLPALPSAPSVPGISRQSDTAIKTVINDVVPLVVTTLVGGEVPTSVSAGNAAPLFSGFSFLPVAGRPQ